MTRIEDVPALAPLLEAFRRGTKRSRLRLLVAVCPRGHTLAEVFPTSAGPYVVWEETTRWGPKGRFDIQAREWVAALVPEVVAGDLDMGTLVGSECRCTKATQRRLSEVRAHLDAGERRVVWPLLRDDAVH